MTTSNAQFVLVGLSGVGKSTVGRLLAERRACPLYDTDALVVEAQGRPIAQIFAEQGEATFRDMETAALEAALEHSPAVIATGGGIVLRASNRALLRRRAFVVWLDAPTPALVARLLAHNEERPLLASDPAARIDSQRQARAPLYAEVAHLRLAVEQHTPEELVELILDKTL
jgi:shikimate kinase